MTDHASRSHKRFAASAAERWMNCPGSIRLCESVPESPTSYALEGTKAHELLEQVLKNVGSYGVLPEWICAGEEFREAVLVAHDYVKDLKRKSSSVTYGVEVPIAVTNDVGGTLDFYLDNRDQLHIIDFKYGSGVAVEVKGNKQLQIYALGVLPSQFVNDIVLTIIQPRAHHPDGPIRSWTITPADLIDFEADVQEAVERCLEPDAPLVVGEEQCRWCPAKLICPAREKMALEMASEAFSGVRTIDNASMVGADAYSPEYLGEILAKKDMVVDWLDAVEKEAYKLARGGVQIPGRKLVAPVGRRQWDGEPRKIAKQLASTHFAKRNLEDKVLMAEDFLEENLIGITAAEKKLGGKIPTELTKKSIGALQLVADDDPRPAIQPASQAFGGVVSLPPTETGETTWHR